MNSFPAYDCMVNIWRNNDFLTKYFFVAFAAHLSLPRDSGVLYNALYENLRKDILFQNTESGSAIIISIKMKKRYAFIIK